MIRRSHKKSRNGCRYCKQRKIKCDEAKPGCGNCIRLSIICDYSKSDPDAPRIATQSRGRPKKKWTVVHVANNEDPASTIPPPAFILPEVSRRSSSSTILPFHLTWSAQDVEIFHHYMTEVAVGDQNNQIWRKQVPRMAFRHHSLFHLLLAVAAMHLSRQKRARSIELLDRAERHMTIGLQWTTQALENPNSDNCAELYFSTILICTYTFAKTPGPRHLLVVADGHEVAWWTLFRGVRILIETIGFGKIQAAIEAFDETEIYSTSEGRTTTEPDKEYIIFGPMEWEAALHSLVLLVSQRAAKGHKASYEKAVAMLQWCFQNTFGTTMHPKPSADAKFETIMAWLYVLEDDYVASLQAHEPLALIILAHFAVLLQTLESVWFIEGWATHMLRGILEILAHSPERRWLQWPIDKIECGQRFVDKVRAQRQSIRR